MHEKRYTRLKLKMLLLVLTGAVVVCALSLFLVEVVVDGFLQDPVSRLFVWVATNLFGQSTEVALDAYETYVRANKSEILSLGLVVLMLLAFYVAMGRFTTWLEEIRWATHSLADTAEEEIRLEAMWDGETVTCQVSCYTSGDVRLLCAFYDADGRLLAVRVRAAEQGEGTHTFRGPGEGVQAACFLLDEQWAPLCSAAEPEAAEQ